MLYCKALVDVGPDLCSLPVTSHHITLQCFWITFIHYIWLGQFGCCTVSRIITHPVTNTLVKKHFNQLRMEGVRRYNVHLVCWAYLMMCRVLHKRCPRDSTRYTGCPLPVLTCGPHTLQHVPRWLFIPKGGQLKERKPLHHVPVSCPRYHSRLMSSPLMKKKTEGANLLWRRGRQVV